MKRKFLFYFSLIIVMILVTPPSAYPYFSTTKLTDNSYYDGDSQINDNGDIIWGGNGIFLYDYSTKTTNQLSTSGVLPDINNNKDAVWMKQGSGSDYDTEIFLYNNSSKTTTQITNNAVNDANPKISNYRDVVWGQVGIDPNKSWDIYYRTGDTGYTYRETNNSYYDGGQQINGQGKAVWFGGPTFHEDIYLSSWGVVTKITNDSKGDYYPQINSDADIVWQSFDNADSDYEISFYDNYNHTTSQITNNNYNDNEPAINDNKDLVWWGEQPRFGVKYKEVFLYDAATKTISQITNNSRDDIYPYINNDKDLVWIENDGDNEIFYYDSSTKTISQITNNSYDDRNVKISNAGNIVWEGWDGNDWEIFLAKQGIPTSKFNIGVILAELNGGPHSTQKTDYDSLVKNINDYYLANSYGKVELNFNILDNNGNWYQLDNNDDYYKGKEKDLIADAINEVETVSGSDPRLNNDILLVVHSGVSSNASSEGVLTPTAFRTLNSALVAEKSHPSGSMSDNLNPYSHEIGHILGEKLTGKPLPDLRYMGNMGNIKGTDYPDDEAWYDLMAVGLGGAEAPNLSSFTKELLGFSNYRDINSGVYTLKSLNSMQGEEEIAKLNINDKRYYILENRQKNDPYPYDFRIPKEDLIIYGIDKRGAEPVFIEEGSDGIKYGKSWKVNILNLDNPEGNNHYINPIDRVEIEVTEKKANGDIVVEVKKDIPIQESRFGFVMRAFESFLGKIGEISLSSPIYGSLPDLDLHVYTDDGKHIGRNYVTGEYEYGIQGTLASGDMFGSDEWILLPTGISGYHFIVNGYDIEQFLINNPEYAYLSNEEEYYEMRGYLLDPMTNFIYESSQYSGHLTKGSNLEWLINYSENSDGSYNVGIAPVPEPTTIILFGIGGILTLCFRKKKE